LMDQMHQQGKWPLPKKASQTELVEIFLSKSYWHSHVTKAFSTIARYPEMVRWLEHEDKDIPSDLDVWHIQKSEYGFKELQDWVANGGTLDIAVKRNVEKAKAKAKAKAKGKAMEESDEDEKEEEDKMEIEKRSEEKKKASGSKAKKTHKKK